MLSKIYPQIALVLVLAITQAWAQLCAFDVFSQCKTDNTNFKSATCDPLASKPNGTALVQACQCYQSVNLALCYKQCEGNTTLLPELAGVNQERDTYCRLAGLNPQALPQPPPWQTNNLPTPSAAPAATQTAGASATPTGTSQPAAQGGASSLKALGMGWALTALSGVAIMAFAL
ncbi:hypothetical protein HK097_009179 [Rhizophlyctis rosea]|uniref:Uncharacterized protein n=1 Tax=Rhizophlyctis rosea TaxID=64517 RepID=A0AAD5SIJ0_9FUNG|nr:hypothetical protein HK097_009179 [Rhizophlyctis rosea]